MTRQPDPRTLTQMQRYGTSYEVAVTVGDVTTRLTFTARRGKMALLRIAEDHWHQILPMLDRGTPVDHVTYMKESGWRFGPVRVHFTGRTERDVANEMGRIA
jgi:hypothetical protein